MTKGLKCLVSKTCEHVELCEWMQGFCDCHYSSVIDVDVFLKLTLQLMSVVQITESHWSTASYVNILTNLRFVFLPYVKHSACNCKVYVQLW